MDEDKFKELVKRAGFSTFTPGIAKMLDQLVKLTIIECAAVADDQVAATKIKEHFGVTDE
jgi:hypothetical protein